MILRISSVTVSVVVISLHVATVRCTIIAMMLSIRVTGWGNTIVAGASGVVTRVTTTITDRNVVAVTVEFGELLFRRHQSVTYTVCYLPPRRVAVVATATTMVWG